MTRCIVRLVVVCASTIAAVNANAGILVFDNIDEFRAAAGPLVEIDFSILPDGTPTPTSGEFPLTPSFNYTDSGVTFSSPNPDLYVLGQPLGGSLLAVSKSSMRNWIIVGFTPAVYAVAVTTRAELSIFDEDGTILGQVVSGGFVGFTSDSPIVRAVIDNYENGAGIGSIHYTTVPEHTTLAFLAAGLWAVGRRTWV